MGLIKRRQYVIDKKLQIGTAFAVIAASLLVVAVVIAIIAYGATRNNKNLSEVIDTQDKITQAVVAYAEAAGDALKKAEADVVKIKKEEKKVVKPVAAPVAKEKPVKKIAKDEITPPSVTASTEIGISEIVRDHRKNIESMNKMVDYNSWLLWTVTALVLLQGIVLFIVLIIKTHRIAGPIYVMSLYMKQIIAGRFPTSFRSLRDGDSLKDFYDLFVKTVTSMKSGKKGTAKASKKVAKKK